MDLTKSFSCKITDEYGGEYPDAFVAFFDWFEWLGRGAKSTQDDIDSEYTYNHETSGISYYVSYWYRKDLYGVKKSRPLRLEVGGEFVNEFKVDMEHPETVNIFNSEMDPTVKVLHAIELDIIRRNT